MKRSTEYILLTIPMFWFIYIWLVFVFGLSINTDYIPELIWFFTLLVGTPLMFLFGAIYTYWKKHWLWLLTYCVLGGFPIISLYYARFLTN